MAWSYHGHLHISHFHFFSLPDEVKHFYYFALIRTVLFATGGLFLPLFIYSSTKSILLALIYYYVALGPLRLITKPLELWFLKDQGVERAMFVSVSLAGITFLLAYYLTINLTSVLLLGFLMGFSLALYWDSFHISFGLFGRFREVGEEMGSLVVLQSILSIVLPVLSGVFVSFFGFHLFYLIVFLFTLTASIFLVKSLGKTYRVRLSMERVIKAPLKRMHTLEGMMYGFLCFTDLFIYVVLGGAVILFGAVKFIVNLLSALSSYLVGYVFDRRLPLGLGRLLYLLEGLDGMVKTLLFNPIGAAVGDILKWMGAAFHTALAGTLYIIGRNGYPEIVIARSFYITVGKSLALTLVILFSLYLQTSLLFKLSFILGFLSSVVAISFYRDLERLSAAYLEKKSRKSYPV